MLGTAELDVSVGCVAEGVFTLCLFPVTVTVVQQSVREVSSCSSDVRVRCCRMQGAVDGGESDWRSGGVGVELVEAK